MESTLSRPVMKMLITWRHFKEFMEKSAINYMTILMRNYVKFMHRFSQDAFCKNSLKVPWTTILRFVGKIYVIFVLPSTKILQNRLDHVILFNLFEVTDREKEESQRPRQTEGSSPGLSQRDYSSPHWTGLKPGAGSSFWIPDMGNRNPNSWAILHVFPRTLAETWASRSQTDTHLRAGITGSPIICHAMPYLGSSLCHSVTRKRVGIL